MTARVAVFAATRADLFPLAPVLRTLAGAVDLEVTLLAAGDLAGPASALSDVDLTNVAVRPLGAGLSTHDHRAQARAGERIAAGVADALESLSPDAVVVLGDRWELMYAVPPVVLRGVPLVHLHGGEVTEGAVDDRVRHAVTKLADLHCVSGTQAAARLRQLGEPTDRVVVTGAPGLDHLAEVHAASDDELSRLTGQPVVRPLALVTYHPATAAEEDPGTTAEQVLEATAAVAGTVLVTHPGPERGREAVLAVIEHVAARTPNVSVVPSLGASYLPVLAACDVVVGNSSSGIIEAAAFGVPVVDVGARQTGRARGDNVLHAEARQTDIEAAVRTALGADFRERSAHVVNPYGAGGASARVLDVVRRAVQGGLALKPFVDISPGPAA